MIKGLSLDHIPSSSTLSANKEMLSFSSSLETAIPYSHPHTQEKFI